MATTSTFNATLLRVSVGTKVIAGEMSSTFEMTTAEIETTTKDNNGYTSRIPGLRDWNLQTESTVDYSSNGSTVTTFTDLQNAWLNRTSVTLNFATAVTGDLKLSGSAFITSFSISAPMEDKATVSITFTAAGPLALAYI